MEIAIVTGGSNGIGKATALALGRKGIGVVLTYHSNEDSAHEVVREIEKSGSKAVALRLDLSRPSAFGEFARGLALKLDAVWGRSTFEHLVNNGGMGGGMPFLDMTEEYFDKVMGTNFKGPFLLTQRLVRWMADGGSIVNTSSNASRGSFVGYSAYGPSKAALSSWTRYLAKELAPRKIRVNAVSPGPTRTNLGDGAFAKHPEYIKPLADQTALGRIGESEDIARVIVSLLSDEYDWVTAQDIEVSGGFQL